jgi:Na+/H+-dicarboxylate symporter/ABC-type amino acid transport substrate-binding protein
MTEAAGKRKLTMGTKILVGVIAGIAVGVFLGDRVGLFDVVGQVYVGLLQMTVLPYVVVSLIGKIGGLTVAQAKQLGGRAGLVLMALWILSLGVVVVMPLSLPDWQAGTFFSASLVEGPTEFDFLGLYLPTNPFHSLAANVVPATVLFSILVGVALIHVRNKHALLDMLDVTSQTLGNLSNFIVSLSPWGTFALAAAAAGTLSPPELTRLAGYVVTYSVGVVLLTFIVLPGLTAAVTPFRLRHVLSGYREAGLTAFATGKLFAVLPMVISSVRDLLVGEGMDREEAQTTADVYVPLAYPFPNAGKILSILFLPFAAWFVGRPLGASDYPMLLSVGLMSFFGSPVAAIPFLLDLLKLPRDLFPLFLVAGIWCARIGDVLGAMHLYVFTSIAAAWNEGWLRLNPVRIGAWAGACAVATLLAMVANNRLIAVSLESQEPPAALVEGLELSHRFTSVLDDVATGPNPAKLGEGETRIDRIRRTKILRIGYAVDLPPYSYRNRAQHLVGFEIDLLQRLASDLGAELQPVPYDPKDIGKALREDWFDIGGGAIASSIDHTADYRETTRYLNLHLAFLVLDHRAKEFRTPASIGAIDDLAIAHVRGGYFVRTHRYKIPNATIVDLDKFEDFVKADPPPADALLVSAETGSILTMLHPRFSLVIPEGTKARSPVVFALPTDAPELGRLVDTWIALKDDDSTLEQLYDHWILGKQTQQKPERWSIIKNVLGWVD